MLDSKPLMAMDGTSRRSVGFEHPSSRAWPHLTRSTGRSINTQYLEIPYLIRLYLHDTSLSSFTSNGDDKKTWKCTYTGNRWARVAQLLCTYLAGTYLWNALLYLQGTGPAMEAKPSTLRNSLRIVVVRVQYTVQTLALERFLVSQYLALLIIANQSLDHLLQVHTNVKCVLHCYGRFPMLDVGLAWRLAAHVE